MEAHELLIRLRPGHAAARETWLTYYRRSASVYAEVAEVDRGHHHEAMYWANRERAKATSLQAEISSGPGKPAVQGVNDKPEDSGPDATL